MLLQINKSDKQATLKKLTSKVLYTNSMFIQNSYM
jgi:hypothetical protein